MEQFNSPSILGIGIDTVETSRIDRAVKRWGNRFLKRVFSESEIAYCNKKNSEASHLAARFAAKEACLKSLGLGLDGGIALNKIIIANNQSGKPELTIDKDLSAILKKSDSFVFHLSMTHTKEYASAIVILEARVDRL